MTTMHSLNSVVRCRSRVLFACRSHICHLGLLIMLVSYEKMQLDCRACFCFPTVSSVSLFGYALVRARSHNKEYGDRMEEGKDELKREALVPHSSWMSG